MPDSTKRRFAPIVLLIALAPLGGVLLVWNAMIEPLALVAGATALCLLCSLVAGLVWSRGRRRQATPDFAVPDMTFWPRETAGDVPAETELDALNAHASTRTLQLQIRSLASALEELQDLGLDDLRGTTVRDLIDDAALSQGRALVTVRALHDVLAELPGAAATDRIEAALNRLGVEAWFERPALTLRPGRTYVTFASPPHVGVPEDVPAPPAVEPHGGDPGAGQDAASDADVDATSDIPATAPADRRVLPVPAPAPVAEEPRSRRRRGRISTV